MRCNIQCMCVCPNQKNLVRVSYGGGVIKPAARQGQAVGMGCTLTCLWLHASLARIYFIVWDQTSSTGSCLFSDCFGTDMMLVYIFGSNMIIFITVCRRILWVVFCFCFFWKKIKYCCKSIKNCVDINKIFCNKYSVSTKKNPKAKAKLHLK